MKHFILFLACLFLLYLNGTAQTSPKREFRGAWIATYANIDWPNRTQTPAQQRSAFISIVEHHKATGMNALFIQIRSQCDAMYESSIEPWSADLTGTQGKAPSTPWDPMQFMIEECHKRGIEFHAWINPYRAIANYNNINSFDPRHVARQHPEWLLSAGLQRILNPALPQVREYVTHVIEDIVKRYDIDGIHFDDYFYPNAVFNDDESYAADPRGFTDRGDWRRDNVNMLIKKVHESVTSLKPWVKFGISPSGIYRNSTNPAIGSATNGLQHYTTLYADSRKWLQEGWIDYLAPQVYWFIGQAAANYSVLIPWWNNNASGRHIYIGMAGYKVNDPAQGAHWANPSQIPNQMRMNRDPAYHNIYGQAIYNTSSLRSATKLGFRDSLQVSFYQKPALLPTMPWRDNTPPLAPSGLVAEKASGAVIWLSWSAPAATTDELNKVRQYVIYRSTSPVIDLENTDNILAITNTATTVFSDKVPDPDITYYYTVTALDRYHNESTPSNVTDYLAPAIVCAGNQELLLNTSCSSELPDYRSVAQVSDDVSAPSEITILQFPAAGTAMNGTGDITVTLTATDASGKSATCSFTVTKKDTTPPVVITRNLTRTLSHGTVTITAEEVDNGSWDSCGIDPATLQLSKSTFDCTNTGSNTVTLTAKDYSGNEASATAIITVIGTSPQPSILISRNDPAFTGLPDNTIALGYGAQSLTLTASNSTSAPLHTTYQWSPALGLSSTTTATTEFSPEAVGSYIFTVEATNEFGCTATTSVTIHVIDVRCANDKVIVCQKTGSSTKPSVQLCISASDVEEHLRKGNTLGACATAVYTAKQSAAGTETYEASVLSAYPNPFTNQTTLQFRLGTSEEKAILEIYDLHGNKVKKLYEGSAEANRPYSFEVDATLSNGSFLIARLITQGKAYNFKLLKSR